MSDTSQGPGWWLASDGKWYPPEQWTGPPNTSPLGAQTTERDEAVAGDARSPEQSLGSNQETTPGPASYPTQPPMAEQGPQYGGAPWAGAPAGPPPAYGSAPYGQAPYGQAPYGQAPYSQAPYGQPIYVAPGQAQQTNGLAIASLVCSLCGFVLFIPGIVGIILGFVARGQITRSNGAQKGSGMALAGIIIGFVWVALLVLTIVNGVVNANNDGVITWVGLGGFFR